MHRASELFQIVFEVPGRTVEISLCHTGLEKPEGHTVTCNVIFTVINETVLSNIAIHEYYVIIFILILTIVLHSLCYATEEPAVYYKLLVKRGCGI